MIPVNIISKVDIPTIQEETIADLIRAEILRAHPELQINEIIFERKLSPPRVIANVDAQLKNSNSSVQAELPLEEKKAEATIDEEDAPVDATTEDKPARKKVFG